MPSGLKIGDRVFLPVARVSSTTGTHAALQRYKVVASKPEGRSIQVDLGNGTPSHWIGTSVAHLNLGIYLIRIGDFSTEDTLLDPLWKSVLQYSRLLLVDDYIRGVRVRSLEELRLGWQKEGAVYSHVVLIGHGRGDSIQFGVDGWVSAENLAQAFNSTHSEGRVFVSLCCVTGRKGFAAQFSAATLCSCLIAPFQSVHGAIASQFCQTFLAHHLLEGRTSTVAFKNARRSTPRSATFRLWRSGLLQ